MFLQLVKSAQVCGGLHDLNLNHLIYLQLFLHLEYSHSFVKNVLFYHFENL